jgi:hypothetical protein
MKADMRVQKFRSIEEMNLACVSRSREPDFEQFLRHCARYWALVPRAYPRGVFRFTSIEEADKAGLGNHPPAGGDGVTRGARRSTD